MLALRPKQGNLRHQAKLQARRLREGGEQEAYQCIMDMCDRHELAESLFHESLAKKTITEVNNVITDLLNEFDHLPPVVEQNIMQKNFNHTTNLR